MSRHHTEEAKRRIGKATWQRYSIEENIEKARVWAKLSRGHTGYHHTEEAKVKIGKANSAALTGRPFSIEHRLNLSGKNCHFWKGGISFEPYPINFNNSLKERIRKRDNYICQLCGIMEAELGRLLDVHHIDYNKENTADNNLISLCRRCNAKVNTNREYWQTYFRIALLTPYG